MYFIKKLYSSSKIFVGMMAILALQSCTQSGYIVTKKALDPFTVYSYQPLSMPPIYYLSSQEISDERRFIKEGQDRVQSLLFESNMGSLSPQRKRKIDLSKSDEKFLALADANQDLSQVRKMLDEESLGLTYKDPSFIERLFSDHKGEALDNKLSEYKKYNR
ncbi:MAG: DUF3035 domain-containing protein [Alphaproteobacteria bacterium]|jgi:hypothetical protein|nr:DUF3035 domain-containing protein [Alphaproteobacteria bacterium]